MTMKPIAILWPDEQNYARFRGVSNGIEQATLDAYRAAIAGDLETKERAGLRFGRMPFDVEALIAFARRHGSDRVTSQIRSTFAAKIQMERDLATRH